RICDVYGTGFFYIPGTETCMHIGGYYRFETRFGSTGAAYASNMNWFSRFQLSVDVRNETEWGTLRGYAEGHFDYGWINAGANLGLGINAVAGGYFGRAYLNQGYIEVIGASGTLRMGLTDTAYSRFLGYGSGNVFGGTYNVSTRNEISYTFSGSNGFSAILALVQDADQDFVPDIEGGVNFAQGWGSIGVIAGYDESAGTWGAKGVLRFNAPNGSFSGGLHVMYSSGGGSYGVTSAANVLAPWSVLAHVKGQFTAKVAGTLSAQWFSGNGAFTLSGGLDIRPVDGLRIRPEVAYATDTNLWNAVVRFDREIP
uniref:porin n=1 Tax=Mesorhizobium sp. Z1-4 TaxID=2448478 RepID=UPI0013DF9F38